jgi:hypothetical protein
MKPVGLDIEFVDTSSRLAFREILSTHPFHYKTRHHVTQAIAFEVLGAGLRCRRLCRR